MLHHHLYLGHAFTQATQKPQKPSYCNEPTHSSGYLHCRIISKQMTALSISSCFVDFSLSCKKNASMLTISFSIYGSVLDPFHIVNHEFGRSVQSLKSVVGKRERLHCFLATGLGSWWLRPEGSKKSSPTNTNGVQRGHAAAVNPNFDISPTFDWVSITFQPLIPRAPMATKGWTMTLKVIQWDRDTNFTGIKDCVCEPIRAKLWILDQKGYAVEVVKFSAPLSSRKGLSA
jgi:hypothetical protein